MNTIFRNTNGYDVFLSVDGHSLKIPPYSEKTVSRGDDGAMRLTVKMKTESYTEKVKRSFWLFFFYRDHHIVLETDYCFIGVQDGDVFDIIAEEERVFDPDIDGVIYDRAAVHPKRSIYSETDFRVLVDTGAIKKEWRKDNRKNGLFEFFLDPLIDVGADGCSMGCLSTIVFWAIIIGCIVKFGFMAVLKWILVIYLAFAVLSWTIKAGIDCITSNGKTKAKRFDEYLDPLMIKEKFKTHDFGAEKKKGFFGRKK
jgi:hypothetical protein